MQDKPRFFLQNLIPFLVIGVSIALFLSLLFVFAYVLVWGLIIGGVLWIASIIKNYFFPQERAHIPIKKKSGRIIEHDIKNETKK